MITSSGVSSPEMSPAATDRMLNTTRQELEEGKWFLLRKHGVAIGGIVPWEAIDDCLGRQAAEDLVQALRGRPERDSAGMGDNDGPAAER